MRYAIQIKTDGSIARLAELELEDTEENTKVRSNALNKAVGGMFQLVYLPHLGGKSLDMEEILLWMNEEGKLMNLPHNPYAQFFWDSVFGTYTDYIVGDVVIEISGSTYSTLETIVTKAVSRVNEYTQPRAVFIGE